MLHTMQTQVHFERDMLPVLRQHGTALRQAVADGSATAAQVIRAYKVVLHRSDAESMRGLRRALRQHGIETATPD